MLLRDLRAESLQVILITSATKGEGKSSLSSHLAISLARTGRRTLLVDFDLRSPRSTASSTSRTSPASASCSATRPTLDEVDPAGDGRPRRDPRRPCDAEAIRALGQDSLPASWTELRRALRPDRHRLGPGPPGGRLAPDQPARRRRRALGLPRREPDARPSTPATSGSRPWGSGCSASSSPASRPTVTANRTPTAARLSVEPARRASLQDTPP